MANQNLPIAAYRGEIISAIAENSVVIITAETGAGKSTQVPQFLLEEGNRVLVTQPRRLAARTVAERVAWEVGGELGGLVGFRTAQNRQDSQSTRCLFCTDGLALVRELMGIGGHNVLVLDEVHEWNLNMEVLVAWAKRQIEAGARYRVVIMSATLQAEALSEYFGNVPVIRVPGRLHPVTVQARGSSLEEDVAQLVRDGRNVLVFQPGKREISKTVQALDAMNLDAEILSLHGQLTAGEQARCFQHYNRPKVVVSTNVAQTSVTIDDIDAVVDSGMERRVELAGGVEGLYLKAISRADAEQRKGRAGRTRPGIYIDWCQENCGRIDFPVSEILRTRLDQTVLRLACQGVDAGKLEFFHQPPREQILDAKRSLVALGCVENERVTRIGRLVSRLPVSVQYGRMIVAAERLGVVDDVVSIAAILETGEITDRRGQWQSRFCPAEKESDALAQLAVFNGAQNLRNGELQDAGVHRKSFFRCKDTRQMIARALRGKVRMGSSGNREAILKAIASGMVDHLFKSDGYDYQNGSSGRRELARESVVSRRAKWIVGIPWDLQIQTRRGKRTLRLIRAATVVDPTWLIEVAPQLAKTKTGLRPVYSSEKDVVTSVTERHFNEQKVSEETVEDAEHPEATNLFANWLASQMT